MTRNEQCWVRKAPLSRLRKWNNNYNKCEHIVNESSRSKKYKNKLEVRNKYISLDFEAKELYKTLTYIIYSKKFYI